MALSKSKSVFSSRHEGIFYTSSFADASIYRARENAPMVKVVEITYFTEFNVSADFKRKILEAALDIVADSYAESVEDLLGSGSDYEDLGVE